MPRSVASALIVIGEGFFIIFEPILILSYTQFDSMKIRAKFMCTSITDNGYNKNANLTAVYGKEGENADFANATPSGTLNIAIDNDTPAANFFKPQEAYYLTFEKADKQ